MGFRSPLRNEWERAQPGFEEMAKQPGRAGVIGRMMVDFMPVMVNAMERERDKQTAPSDLFDGVAAICGQLIEEAIEKNATLDAPASSLHRMLSMINRVVAPRITAKRSKIILPGQ